MKRGWLRIVALASAGIVLFLLGSFLLLQSPTASKLLLNRARAYLRNSGIELNASRMRLNLAARTVTLENVTVRSVSAPELPSFFKASHVYAKPGIRNIIGGLIALEDLQVSQAEINYTIDKNGKSNLPGSGRHSGPSPEFLLVHAEINPGAFVYEDQRSNISLRMPVWRLSMKGNRITLDHHIDFSTPSASTFAYQGREASLDRVQFSGNLQKKNLTIQNLQLHSLQSQILISGSVKNFPDPDLNLLIEPDLNIGKIARLMGSGEDFKGRIAGSLKAAGRMRDLRVEAQLNGSGISAGPYHGTDFGLRARAAWDTKKIEFSHFEVESPEGSVRGTAELYMPPGSGTNALKAELRDFNIYPAWKLIEPPFDIASRATGKFSLAWKGRLTAAATTVDAQIRLAGTQNSPTRNVLPLSGMLRTQMHAGRMTGSLRSFAVMGALINGTFALSSFKTMEADVEGSIPDIDTPLTQTPKFLGSRDRSLVGIKMAGAVHFRAQAAGSLSSPKITVSADSSDLQAGELKDLKLSTNTIIQNAKAAFEAKALLPQNAAATAAGSIDFGGRETRLNIDANTSQMPAAAAASMLGAGMPVSGNLTADLHLEGPADALVGNAKVSGEQVTIYHEPLGRFDMGLRLSGGVLQSDPFRITRNPQTPDRDYLDASFSYALKSEQFSFQATGKGLSFRPVSLPAGGALEGTFDLTASGKGTPEEPSIDIRVESPDIRAGQSPLGTISGSATLRGEQARVEMQAPRLNMALNAGLTTHAPYPYEGELQIGGLDLSVLGLTASNKRPLSGVLEAVVKGSGNLRETADSRLSARIDRLELRTPDFEAHTEGPVQAEYRDRSIEMVTPAAIVSGNSRLEIAGRVPLQRAGRSGTLTAKGQIDLAQASAFLPAPEGLSASGMLNLDLSLSGNPKSLTSAGTITLDGGTIQLPRLPVPLSDVTLRATLQDGSLVLQRADAALREGRIALRGEFPFGLLPKNIPVQFPRKEGPARFDLDLTNIRPETTGLLPAGFSGLISLHASGETATTDLNKIKADITFRDLTFKAEEIAVSQNGNSTILIRDGIASVSKLSLTGPETSITANGSAGISPNGPIDIRLTGDFDAALLNLLLGRDLKAAGKAHVQVAAGGNWKAPSLSGSAEMDGGRLTLRNPRVVADSLRIRLDITPKEITVREFKGTLNGGSITMDGSVGYRKGTLDNFNLKAAIQDAFLEFPQGLRSASSGDLTITSSDETIVIGGNIRVLESSYRESFGVGSQLMDYVKQQNRGIVIESTTTSPLLDRLRFDIALRTTTPLLVQNNIARLEATANLRVVGSFAEPSLVGRITLDQGGEIILNQRTYYIERGTILLSDQSRIRPELDIRAQTRVDTYDITMRLTGYLENFSTTLSSEPPLPESELVSLLLTGKTTAETRGREIQMAQSQALSLIAGQAGEEVTREARQALHLSTLRIDPGGLIASESDLGARITLGQDITRDFNLAYSMNLVDGGEQIWAAQYKVTRRLTTQATKQEDNSYRFELRHDFQFGRQPATTRRTRSQTAATRFKIGSIHFEGNTAAGDKTLRDRFKLEPGDRYDFSKVQKGLDRLNNFYTGQRRLESDVRLHRETQDKTVDLNVNIDPGPVVEFSYSGSPIPADAREKVAQAWRNGVFDIERTDDAVAAIKRSLIREGYLNPKITQDVQTTGDIKTVHFNIDAGALYSAVPIRFAGATEISGGELQEALDKAKLELDVYAEPQKVADYLKRYYQERGYIQASVDLPQPHLDPATGTGEVVITVHEGRLFTVGDLEFSGNTAFTYDQLWMVIPTSTGSIFNAKSLQDSERALETLYRGSGYNEASVAHKIIQDSKTGHANVTFMITERRKSVIRDITIEGNSGTSREFIQRQLDFNIGDPLDSNRIDETRRRLYATGVYTSVNFQNEELPDQKPDSRVKNIRVRVRVREIRPYRVQYGLFYDTDRGLGGLADTQNLNFLGRASALGLRLRYDSDLKEARLYFNQPYVKNNFLKLDAAAFAQRENRDAFTANRLGISIIREQAIQRKYVLHYGYRYDHVRWKGVPPDPQIFQASVPVARLVASITRDTRDSILDATRGEFTSHSLEFGPQWLGSETGFSRYYGQYFRYVPLDKYLGKPTKDKEGKSITPSLVYAGALRLGLTSSFGSKDLISPERFFAGGGTTMRGFRQDLLGPTETVIIDGKKVERGTGGEAMLLFNNEIRFPIFGMLHGVGFVDIGNVYSRISDFNFNVRKSAGLGLRIKVKFIPIRLDYGFKLDRRPGESRGAFFFSIGQAF